MKRVLVTGATGFVGRHAIAPLLARGYEVHGTTRGEPPGATHGVEWHRTDLLDAAAVASMLERVGATHLLHFAWYTEHRRYWESPENARWRDAGMTLVRGFRERGGQRAVIAGTCAEYAWGEAACIERVTPCAPATAYGASKLALQQAFEAYCAETGLSGAWGRIFFLYGPGEHPDRLVASVARRLLAGGRAACTHGRQLRDFLHVADAGAAFAALLDSEVSGPVNIASGHATRVADLALQLADAIDARDRVDLGAVPAPAGEPSHVLADVTRLTREVGWTPRHDLASGLADTVAAWRDERAVRAE